MSRRGNGHQDGQPEDDANTEAAEAAGDAPAAAGGSAPEPGAEVPSAEQGLQELPPSREQLEALRRERDEAKDALLRRRAEFENYKKRSERDLQAAAAEAAAAVLRRMLETLDNLERALASSSADDDSLRRGVELTLQDLRTSLEAQGVSVVDPRGERFDPLHHQALLHEPVAGFAEGTVAEVLRKGYLFKDRLLRPALVRVASGGPADEPVDAGGSGEVH